jgi:hypothetical protein
VIRHCITSLHPQANGIGKSGWQRRTAQLEPILKAGRNLNFSCLSIEHQTNNVVVRASRVFEQESGALRAVEERIKKSITSRIAKSEGGAI